MGRLASTNDEETNGTVRVRMHVNGIVQGVGFRPYVYRLARQNDLSGFVSNRLGEVILEVEGRPDQIEAFQYQLQNNIIKPIRIDRVEAVHIAVMGDKQFVILTSEFEGQAIGSFPPDLVVCSNCLYELDHVNSRFYQYPFTSCTACGPRFSTIRSLPYDRLRTSFDRFKVCRLCEKEYEQPSTRRFHAQTIVCPHCGPLIEIRDAIGNILSENWLSICNPALRDGVIMAIKGIGGFHLVCNAKLKHTVEELRARKRRPNKPFALMAKNWLVVKAYFEISDVEMEALTSAAAPIVLLIPKPEANVILPLEVIAPGLRRIGIMLPYTPLHRLLFDEEIEWIVAISGNQSGYPITYDNKDAFQHLGGIADLFVLHSREIVMWVDDSVGQEVDGEFQLMRRSRGYVPEAFPVPQPKKLEVGATVWPTILGVGAELKNTFCFLHNGIAVLSQHIGDIQTLEDMQSQFKAKDHFMQLLQLKPLLTVIDPHPDYLLSREIQKYTSTGLIAAVYHHHAHMAACMAENGIDHPVIGCILDGTGYGPDGTLWGFEILVGDYISFERIQHLQPIIVPGGEAAIHHPWMMGVSLLHEATEDRNVRDAWVAECFPQYLTIVPIVLAQLDGRLPSPTVSSAGRLFDGISAILNICTESTYEGEAALRLSELLEPSLNHTNGIGLSEKYPFETAGDQWNIGVMIRSVMKDKYQNISSVVITRKFHHTLAAMMLEGVKKARHEHGISSVVFSGGVWNNRYLQHVTKELLRKEGFTVYTHRKVPTGDGGIALGQAVCGLWRRANKDVLIGANESDRSIRE